MFFVTTKFSDYVLFAMTPSERAAIGLTDRQEVHLLKRDEQAGSWVVFARWPGSEFSHTDFMVAWHAKPEPTEIGELLSVLPEALRARLQVQA